MIKKKSNVKTEKQIENEILQYLNLMGIFAFKFENNGVYDPVKKTFRMSFSKWKFKGVSDILGIMPNGRFLAIEVKRPGKLSTLTKEQKLFGEKILKMNGIWGCCTSISDAQELVLSSKASEFK